LRHVLDNTKVPSGLPGSKIGNEILVLNFYEYKEEGYILVGGNNKNI